MSGRASMRAIVVADGVTKENLSPDHPHRVSHENVGDREIERLVGWGKRYGEGPLATFLSAVSAIASSQGACGLVLLAPPRQDADGDCSELDRLLSDYADVG